MSGTEPDHGENDDEAFMTTGVSIHLGLAEQGKIHALADEHATALLYYRHAMRLAVESAAPEAFFRHYLECSIESLELMGALDDVLDYCERVDRHYDATIATDERQAGFVARDRVATAQRRALVLAKLGRRAEARAWFGEARARAAIAGVEIPLTRLVDEWLGRGLHIDADRIVAEQRRLCYFAVTAESVDQRRAVSLPSDILVPRNGMNHG